MTTNARMRELQVPEALEAIANFLEAINTVSVTPSECVTEVIRVIREEAREISYTYDGD